MLRPSFNNLNGGYIGTNNTNLDFRSGSWSVGYRQSPLTRFNGRQVIETFNEPQLDANWTNQVAVTLTTERAFASGRSLRFLSSGPSDPNWGEWKPPKITGGRQFKSFEFWYYETSNSSGSGLWLATPDGREVVGFATDNPSWYIWRGFTTGWTNVGNSSINAWHYVRMDNINWSTGQFDWYWERLDDNTNASGTETIDLIDSIESVVVTPTDPPDSSGFNTNSAGPEAHYWGKFVITV